MEVILNIKEKPLIDELADLTELLNKNEQEQLRAFFLGAKYMKKLQDVKQPA